MSDIQDTLGAAFRDIIDHSLTDVHTSVPAQVVAYDAAAQTVDVQPMVKRVIVDPDTRTELVESLPQVTGVPVAFPSGGGYMVTFPIAAGDYVLLAFSERPIDTWLSSGNESDPGDLRHHDLSDAIAIPCIRPTSKAFTSASPSKMVMGKDGGPQVVIDATTVSLFGPSDADFVARASLVDARFAAIEASLAAVYLLLTAHVHTSAAPGSPTSPSPTLAALSAPSGTATGSTKVKLT